MIIEYEQYESSLARRSISRPLLEYRIERISNPAHCCNLHPVRNDLGPIGLGDNCVGKTLFRRSGNAFRTVTNRPDLSRQSDFTETD